MKGQPGCKYILLGRGMSFLLNKTHSNSHKYFSDIIKMPAILINNIFVLIGVRVCAPLFVG